VSISDAANCVTALAALLALLFGTYTFSRQKTASDVEVILGIFDRINTYWDLYASDQCESRGYVLGQILVYFENACFLANNNVISDTAFRCVSDHIYEVWTKMNSDDDTRRLIDSFVSGPSTYCEIKKFVETHRVSIGLEPSWRQRYAEARVPK
jgi:hypothetical protein